MISRVAEQCFWMSRYLERAENMARILEVNYTLLLDFHIPTELQWRPLMVISGIHDYAGPAEADDVQEALTWDESERSSMFSCLAMARENGRIIREVISAEMWERLNHYYLWMSSSAARENYNTNRSGFYNHIRAINQMIHGVGDATMSHGEPWMFFQLGKYLERACQTARILDVKYHMLLPTVEDVGSPVDNAHWTAILMSCSGYEPFHKTPRGGPLDSGLAVVEFLVFDPHFPRSVARCLLECQQASAQIAETPAGSPPNAVDQRLGELRAWLAARDIHDLVRGGLHESLTYLVDSVQEVGEAVAATYFNAVFAPPPTGRPAGQGQSQGPQGQSQSQTRL